MTVSRRECGVTRYGSGYRELKRVSPKQSTREHDRWHQVTTVNPDIRIRSVR